MPTLSFIPAMESELVLWLKNMDTNIGHFTVELAITPAVQALIHDKITAILTAIDNHNQGKVNVKSLETLKSVAKKDVVSYLRDSIVRWKTEPDYTEAIGDVLRIIGATVYPDPHTYKPKIKAEIKPGYILITFVKGGVEGLHIYYRVKGTSIWKFLAYDTHSPYMDASPLASVGVPEVREYMAIGVIAGEEFGGESDIVSVVYEGTV